MPVIYAGLLFVYGIGSTLRKALFEWWNLAWSSKRKEAMSVQSATLSSQYDYNDLSFSNKVNREKREHPCLSVTE
jgi:hypothetical protein